MNVVDIFVHVKFMSIKKNNVNQFRTNFHFLYNKSIYGDPSQQSV